MNFINEKRAEAGIETERTNFNGVTRKGKLKLSELTLLREIRDIENSAIGEYLD